MRFTRGHGFRAVAHESTKDAVEVDCRARALSLQSGEPGFAPQRVRAGHAEQVVIRKAAGGQLIALVRRERTDLVIETFDGDLAVGRVEGRGELGEGLDRIWDESAEAAGMEIGGPGLEIDLATGNTFESDGQRRLVLRFHPAVGGERVIAGEAIML